MIHERDLPRPSASAAWTAASLAAVLAIATIAAGVRGRAADDEPAASAPALGETTDLLRSPPFDRITLEDGSTIDVDPISPRPLPPYDPKKDRSSRAKRTGSNREGLIEIGSPDQAEQEKRLGKVKRPRPEDLPGAGEELDPNNWIALHLLEGQGSADIRDFRVRRAAIKRIDYYEDLLLAEADHLTRTRRFARAFECLLFVKARASDWPGIDPTLNRLLYTEGAAALTAGDFDRGVRLLRELWERDPKHPGLADQLAEAYSQRAERAFELKYYSRGRAVLHELERLAPDHSKYRAARDRFVELARERLAAAQRLDGAARLDAVADSLRIWPELAEAAPVYDRAFAETPTLDVGVFDVPSPLGPWIRSPADARTTRLLYRPILNRDDDDSRQGKPPGQLAAQVESTELGRRLMIRLRSGAAWSDAARPVTAIDAARSLIDRSDPNSRRYRARWADLIERVDAPDDEHVEIRFNRIVLQAGEWLTGPIGAAHAGEDGRIATAGRDRVLATNGPYRCVESTADILELAAAADPSGAQAPRIRRIREVRIADGARAIAALLRGDVSLLDRVPADRLLDLKDRPDVSIGAYRGAAVHLIAIDGRNPALRNRSLKRGLSYAIDRKGLLEGRILKRPADERNRAADGPLPKGSYADAPDVQPFEYDPMLAQMLLAAARKERGDAPISLKFEYPDVPEARLAAPVIAEAFRVVGAKSGLKIETVPRRESELEAELRAGRRFDLAYRIVDCSDAVRDLGPVLCPAIDAPASTDPLGSAASLPILQLLLELERASEFPTAKGIATEIDRECRSELPVLPLWQLETHYAWRSRLNGPSKTNERLYQGVESWEIKPWFARDPWTAAPK